MASLRFLSACALLIACAQIQGMQKGTKFIVREGYNQESPIDSFISLRDKRGNIVTINYMNSLFVPRHELKDAFGKSQTILEALKDYIARVDRFMAGIYQIDPLEISEVATELLIDGHFLSDFLRAEVLSGSYERQQSHIKFNDTVTSFLEMIFRKLESILEQQEDSAI